MPERLRLNKYLLTKEQIKAIYNNRYYTKLKLEGRNQSEICQICNGKYSIYTKAKHEKTKKHIKKNLNLNLNV